MTAIRDPRRVSWLLVADGESVHTQRLARALADTGTDVHLAAFGAPHASGALLHTLGKPSTGDLRFVRALPRLARIIRQLSPDIVHAHYLSSYGVMAALVKPRRLIQTAWGSDLLVTAQQFGRRRLASFALRRATLATGDSTSLLDVISMLAPRTPRIRFVFGPPLNAFGDARPRKQDVILSPRSHEKLYRVDLILKAWALAQKQLPSYRLVVAGTGSETGALKRIAPPMTDFVGQLPHAELMSLAQRSRVVVSLPTTDATSAAVLEALACRCAVVATDLDANREWLAEEYLVPIDADESVVADRIAAVVDRPLALDKRWALESQVQMLLGAVEPMRPA